MSTGKFLATESESIKDGSGLVGCLLGPGLRLLRMTCPLSTQNLAHTKQRLSPGRPKHKCSYKVEKRGRLEGAGLCSNGTRVFQEDPGHYRVQGMGFLGSRTWNKNPFPGPVEYESANSGFSPRAEHRPATHTR